MDKKRNKEPTSFVKVYDSFLSRVTDDMYMEMTELETYRMLENLLIDAIPWFEFPRIDLNNYELSNDYIDETTYCGIESDMMEVRAILYDNGHFEEELTQEEISILSAYMIVEWLTQQLASVENTRMKYSGSDFKFTSQANHLQKLITLKKEFERVGFHLQRLYKRRKSDEDGIMHSTFSSIMESSPSGRGYVRRRYNEF